MGRKRATSRIAIAASFVWVLARGELNTAPGSSPTSLILSDAIYERYLRSARISTPGLFPYATDATGSWSFLPTDSWTSGFYPGVLYLLRERQTLCPSASHAARNTDWLGLARRWSVGVQPLAEGNSQGHDQGFLAIPFIEELKINPGDKAANDTVTSFAYLLADRYSKTVRATRSWESGPNDFLVVMDNMMNLELLFNAAGANPNTFPSIAENHAKTTTEHHLRGDGSSFHVVDYDPGDGHVQRQYTAQGYADWSTWTRGQAWGVYGFAKMYEYTQDQAFLTTSLEMARSFINRLASSPSTIDGVPAWDFDAPPPTSADTSSASVAAAGFMYLADGLEQTQDATGAQFWRGQSLELLSNTARQFFAPNNSDSDWQSILTNGTAFYSKGQKDQGLIYGDYYFVETGNLFLKRGLIVCPTLTEQGSYLHNGYALSTHLVLVLSCVLFTTALLTL